MAAVIRNRFYATIGIALAVFTFVAFARTYYLRYWFDVPPTTVLLHLHSIAFTAWFVLFVIQTRLIAKENYRTHMQLGIAGIFVAALVVILGYATAVVSAAAPRPRPMGMNSQQFSLIPLVAISFFAVLVTAAVILRKRAQLHKRLMTLAMISVLGPPAARLVFVTHSDKYFGPILFGVTAVFLAWCLVSDWRKYRIVHPVYSIGGAILLISLPVRFLIAQTPAWENVGRWLAGM
ncbi:MAG TPA: hypothetical protein VGO61_16760 [Steroidobacteraceae bacterium]|jgi:hypothetical protein|nr:hypothetical protein [Steroidobacteraceae bacterium]